MVIDISVLHSVDKHKWNTNLSQVPEGHLHQTTYWADFMTEYVKADPIFITAKDEHGKTAGQLLLFKEGFMQRFLLKNPLTSISIPLSKRFMPTLTWLYGPVIFDKSNQKDISDSILSKVNEIAKKEHVYMARDIQPAVHGDLDMSLIDSSFKGSGFDRDLRGTFFVDLSPELDTLWMNLKKVSRKNVKRCEKQGVVVERIKDKKDIRNYCRLLVEGKRRLGHKMSFSNSLSNFDTLWDHLRKRDGIEVFLARHGDRYISGLLTVAFNGIINEMGVAHSNYALKNRMYAQDLIKWEIIKWGHEKGYRIYDLTGVNPDPKTPKEEGIYRFKAKWGGELVTCNIYSKIYSKNKEKIINFLKKCK